MDIVGEISGPDSIFLEHIMTETQSTVSLIGQGTGKHPGPICTDMYRYAPICTDMYRYVPICTDMHRVVDRTAQASTASYATCRILTAS